MMSATLAPPSPSPSYVSPSASSVFHEELSDDSHHSESEQRELEAAAEQQAIESSPALLTILPPPPSWSAPKLRVPIVIPEQTGQFGAPFSRCFPPILNIFRVGKNEFIDMIDHLNKVWAPSGFWSTVDVAGNIVGIVPEPACLITGIALSVVARTALRVSQMRASNAFLKVLNEEFFEKRGLRVKVVDSKKVKTLLKADNWNDDVKMHLDFNSPTPLQSPSSPSLEEMFDPPAVPPPEYIQPPVPSPSPSAFQVAYVSAHPHYYSADVHQHSQSTSSTASSEHSHGHSSSDSSHGAALSSTSSHTSISSHSGVHKDANDWAKRRMKALGDLVEELDFDNIPLPAPAPHLRPGQKAVNRFEDVQARIVRKNYNGMQGRLEKRIMKAEEKARVEEDPIRRERYERKAGKKREKLNERANKETEKLSWIVILNVDDKEGWKVLDNSRWSDKKEE
ncbi:hypothetical protein BT69DRAFT_1353649 [Atractiella rhizophila]|nr:hypothetical protein BT69DRAFT_1353649 [Atractiella rhizophila]